MAELSKLSFHTITRIPTVRRFVNSELAENFGINSGQNPVRKTKDAYCFKM